jgi:DNA polymerase-1
MAINAPIQGTQSDIIRIAMVKIFSYIKNLKLTKDVRMLLQVHDELIFEIKDEKLAVVVPTILEIMTSVLDKEETKGVPILAEIKTGSNWEDLTPKKLSDFK